MSGMTPPCQIIARQSAKPILEHVASNTLTGPRWANTTVLSGDLALIFTSARDARDTDWSQVVALYDQLVRLDSSPIIALNRAVAVAELDGPEVALAAVDRLEPRLAGYHAYHAARADLLCRLGRSQESRAAYSQAIELAGNTAETAYLTRRHDQLG